MSYKIGGQEVDAVNGVLQVGVEERGGQGEEGWFEREREGEGRSVSKKLALMLGEMVGVCV